MDIKQHSKEWEKNKIKYIGANDCACLLNVGFIKKSDLIEQKIKQIRPEFNEKKMILINRGLEFEPFVKQEYEKRNNIIIKECGQRFHKTYKFLTATPDGFIESTNTLIEFKIKQNINESIDFKYFVQCQIQMEVFDIDNCILCENIINTENAPKIIKYKETLIKRDKQWFNNIINEIKDIYEYIEEQRAVLNKNKNKKRKTQAPMQETPPLLLSSHNLYNYINNDKLVDWFELYHQDKKQNNLFLNFIGDKTKQFRNKFTTLLKDKLQDNDLYIDINRKYVPDYLTDINIQIADNLELIEDTKKAMADNIPIIFNGVLSDNSSPDILKYYKYNVLIKVKYLNYLFKIPDEFTNKEQNAYINIQIYYAKLDLTNDKLHLIRNPKQTRYILNSLFANDILNKNQTQKISNGLIIGRKSVYKSKVKLSCFDRIAFVNYDKKDIIYKKINEAIKWHTLIRTKEAADWTIQTIPHSYLPNMNVNNDQWADFKNQIAQERRELTLINGLSINTRDKLHSQGIYTIEDYFKPEFNLYKDYDINIHLKEDFIQLNKNASECIYLDFEYLNDLNDDLNNYPYTNDDSIIYLIGIYYKKKYLNFCDLNEEKQIFEQFLRFLKTNNIKTIFYWGSFEFVNMYKLIDKYHLTYGKILIDSINKIDVCKYFKSQISIYKLITNYNIYNYGIKDIARGLYNKGIIKHIWPDNMTGGDSMVELWNNLDNIGRIIEYNKNDCIILHSIIFNFLIA